ncbi:MAG: hypothetical protein ACK56I_17195, partial [bacterium]
MRYPQPSQVTLVLFAQLQVPPFQAAVGRLIELFQLVHLESEDDHLSAHTLLLGKGYLAASYRTHLLTGWSGYHEGLWELAAVHRVPRRRLLADDGEHVTPANSHVDELTTLRCQYHHARESTIPLEVPLTSTGKLVTLQG